MSHTVAPEKMPVCTHFLAGTCNRDPCPYSHVKVSSSAAVCEKFLKGFCPDGSACKLKHVLVCQAFLQGKCRDGVACEMHHQKIPPSRSQKSQKKSTELERDRKEPQVQPDKGIREDSVSINGVGNGVIESILGTSDTKDDSKLGRSTSGHAGIMPRFELMKPLRASKTDPPVVE